MSYDEAVKLVTQIVESANMPKSAHVMAEQAMAILKKGKPCPQCSTRTATSITGSPNSLEPTEPAVQPEPT